MCFKGFYINVCNIGYIYAILYVCVHGFFNIYVIFMQYTRNVPVDTIVSVFNA